MYLTKNILWGPFSSLPTLLSPYRGVVYIYARASLANQVRLPDIGKAEALLRSVPFTSSRAPENYVTPPYPRDFWAYFGTVLGIVGICLMYFWSRSNIEMLGNILYADLIPGACPESISDHPKLALGWLSQFAYFFEISLFVHFRTFSQTGLTM